MAPNAYGPSLTVLVWCILVSSSSGLSFVSSTKVKNHLLNTVMEGGVGGFSQQEYWDSFHSRDDASPFEWYASWKRISSIVQILRPPSASVSVLVPGCGDSSLCQEMALAGYGKVIGLDFSPRAIERCRQIFPPGPCLEFKEGDVTQTEFPDGSFDLIVDKGTFDAVTGDDGQEAAQRASLMLAEMCRLTAAGGGTLLIISLLEPFVLRALLSFFSQRTGWAIEISLLPAPPRLSVGAGRKEMLYPPFVLSCLRQSSPNEAGPVPGQEHGAGGSLVRVVGGPGFQVSLGSAELGEVEKAVDRLRRESKMRKMHGGQVICVMDVMPGAGGNEDEMERIVREKAGGLGWELAKAEMIEIGFGISKMRCSLVGQGDEGALLDALGADLRQEEEEEGHVTSGENADGVEDSGDERVGVLGSIHLVSVGSFDGPPF